MRMEKVFSEILTFAENEVKKQTNKKTFCCGNSKQLKTKIWYNLQLLFYGYTLVALFYFWAFSDVQFIYICKLKSDFLSCL